MLSSGTKYIGLEATPFQVGEIESQSNRGVCTCALSPLIDQKHVCNSHLIHCGVIETEP